MGVEEVSQAFREYVGLDEPAEPAKPKSKKADVPEDQDDVPEDQDDVPEDQDDVPEDQDD